MNNIKKYFLPSALLTAFVLWTWAVSAVDVQPIGPLGTAVGFATLNGLFHRLTGVHMGLYTLTDWLGLASLGICAGFGILGLVQWVGRGSIRRVDRSLLILGGFYVLVLGVFLLFELAAVNYRPVLIEGRLEASYPSSTTMLVMCVMPTAMLQLKQRFKAPAQKAVCAAIAAFTAFMVMGRLLSGVHWLTDIIGGALLSAGLVLLYDAVCGLAEG